MRTESLSSKRAFPNLKAAQQALDEWVAYYNNERPHQSLDMATPAQRFTSDATQTCSYGRDKPGRTAVVMIGSAGA
jgi:transposase InsO family protein